MSGSVFQIKFRKKKFWSKNRNLAKKPKFFKIFSAISLIFKRGNLPYRWKTYNFSIDTLILSPWSCQLTIIRAKKLFIGSDEIPFDLIIHKLEVAPPSSVLSGIENTFNSFSNMANYLICTICKLTLASELSFENFLKSFEGFWNHFRENWQFQERP